MAAEIIKPQSNITNNRGLLDDYIVFTGIFSEKLTFDNVICPIQLNVMNKLKHIYDIILSGRSETDILSEINDVICSMLINRTKFDPRGP